MAYPIYPAANAPQSEIDMYWAQYFVANPIDYKNLVFTDKQLEGLDPANYNIPLTDNFANGSGLNQTNINSDQFKQYVANQKADKYEGGDFSELPKYVEADNFLSLAEKIVFYENQIKNLEFFAKGIKNNVERVARDIGIDVMSNQSLGALFSIVGKFVPYVSTVYSAIESLLKTNELNPKFKTRLENLKHASDIITGQYNKYSDLLKTLKAEQTRSAIEPPPPAKTNYLPYIAFFVFALFLLFALKKR